LTLPLTRENLPEADAENFPAGGSSQLPQKVTVLLDKKQNIFNIANTKESPKWKKKVVSSDHGKE
jgi:hypothetical protein